MIDLDALFREGHSAFKSNPQIAVERRAGAAAEWVEFRIFDENGLTYGAFKVYESGDVLQSPRYASLSYARADVRDVLTFLWTFLAGWQR